ncbi:MAG: ABC transporter ATP-binding protein [Acidimicrobiales bacterium]
MDLRVDEGGAVGLVGESGCGKSVTMLAVLGLLPSTTIVTGSVRYRGAELLGAGGRELRRVRGAHIGMIFQDPVTALDPVLTVGHQIAEGIRVHDRDVSRRDARNRAAELLDAVGIPEPGRRARQYPHEFSGGMCQRAMIAMAMANNPDVLIADEPTTALDVTIQAQILELLNRLRRDHDVAVVLISHDLGVVAGMVEQVAVMYAGRIVERGSADQVYSNPRHPYTRGLLGALPRLTGSAHSRLVPIEGRLPSLLRPPSGCAFHPRCKFASDRCLTEDPGMRALGEVEAACHHAEDVTPAIGIDR